MNSEQIIQEATEAVEKGLPCAFFVKPLLEVAKNQKLEIEILIRKKEALKDEIAEQQAEIERLRKDRDELYEQMSERQKAEVAIAKRMGKSEAHREFAEKLCKDRVSNDPVVIAVKVELEELTESK